MLNVFGIRGQYDPPIPGSLTPIYGTGEAPADTTFELDLDSITTGSILREDAVKAHYVMRLHFEDFPSTVDETVGGNSSGFFGLTWDDVIPSSNGLSNTDYLKLLGPRASGDGIFDNKGRLYVDGADRTFLSGQTGSNTSHRISIAELNGGSPVNISGVSDWYDLPKTLALAPQYTLSLYLEKDGDNTNCSIGWLTDYFDLSEESFNIFATDSNEYHGDLTLKSSALTWVTLHGFGYQSAFRHNGSTEVAYRMPSKFAMRNPLSSGKLVLDYLAVKYAD